MENPNIIVILNGKQFELDVKRAFSLDLLTEFKTKSVGQRFYQDGTEYMLAEVSSEEVALINVKTGSRWDDGVFVRNIEEIDSDEWRQITNGYVFNLISKKTKL